MVSTSRLTRDFKAATDSIPVVAIGSDPVAWGIVPSLARPGGNITGTSVNAGIDIGGKRLELLQAIVPSASRVAYLASKRAWEDADTAAMRQAALQFKIDLVGPPLDPPLQESEYRRVIGAMEQEHVDGLIVGDQAENSTNGRLIVELVAKARLPAIYPNPSLAHVGGLIAYGPDISEMFRYAADQIDQILKGAKPGDIPFYQPTKFELIINLKTTQALGLGIPPSLLAFADEVVE
jgi:putative ABC transport system substrate-binding protein